MARGKSSKFIKVLTSKDTELIKQLSRTGVSTSEQIKNHIGLSDERITKLANSNFISITKEVVEGKTRNIIKLNDKGKKYAREELAVTFFPRVQSNHLYHDIKLTEMYFRLPNDVKETWRSENEIVLSLYSENINLDNCVDATVIIDGETVGIESIGNTYTDDIIATKHEIATTILGCSRIISA